MRSLMTMSKLRTVSEVGSDLNTDRKYGLVTDEWDRCHTCKHIRWIVLNNGGSTACEVENGISQERPIQNAAIRGEQSHRESRNRQGLNNGDADLSQRSVRTMRTGMPKILIVEDDPDSRDALVRTLAGAGYKTLEADNGEKALETILKHKVDLLIADLRLPGMDGLELLKRSKAAMPDIEVLLVTGHGSIEIAVEAMKEGAYDFITKPARKAQLLRAVERAAERQSLARENRALRSQLERKGPRIIHASAEMRNIVRLVEQVAASTATVLITGESGTGKEVIAEAIHALSPRRDRPFLKVSCAALPDTLLESELFGYERGAFTGANARKEGRFELANGGTLFLDEIGEITPGGSGETVAGSPGWKVREAWRAANCRDGRTDHYGNEQGSSARNCRPSISRGPLLSVERY